jgi:hypothetical protein
MRIWAGWNFWKGQPADFSMSYSTRSGRIDIVRLCWLSSRVERFERQSR